MLETLFFILGVLNSLLLIFIFSFRKNIESAKRFKSYYFLLTIPAAVGVFLTLDGGKDVRYAYFLGVFLAFVILQWMYNHIIKIPYRQNWMLLTPYLILYYAMNYGFIMMAWQTSVAGGTIILVLTLIQLTVNLITGEKNPIKRWGER